MAYSGFGVDSVRWCVQIPNYTEVREALEYVVSKVDLPPIKTVTRGPLIVMMIVMPAIAKRK